MLYSQISVHEEIHSFCDAVFYEKLLRGQMECAKKQFCQITTVQGKIICDFLHGQVVLIVFMNVGNGAADIDAVVISFFSFSLPGSFGQIGQHLHQYTLDVELAGNIGSLMRDHIINAGTDQICMGAVKHRML